MAMASSIRSKPDLMRDSLRVSGLRSRGGATSAGAGVAMLVRASSLTVIIIKFVNSILLCVKCTSVCLINQVDEFKVNPSEVRVQRLQLGQ